MCILVQGSEWCKERMAADKVILEQQEAPPFPTASRHASSASQGDSGGDSASSVPGATAQQPSDMATAAVLAEDAASANLPQSALALVSRAPESSHHGASSTSRRKDTASALPNACSKVAQVHSCLHQTCRVSRAYSHAQDRLLWKDQTYPAHS